MEYIHCLLLISTMSLTDGTTLVNAVSKRGNLLDLTRFCLNLILELKWVPPVVSGEQLNQALWIMKYFVCT